MGGAVFSITSVKFLGGTKLARVLSAVFLSPRIIATRGTYASLPDKPDELDEYEYEYEDDYRHHPLLVFVAIAFLIAFAGAIYLAYQLGVQRGIRQGSSSDVCETLKDRDQNCFVTTKT